MTTEPPAPRRPSPGPRPTPASAPSEASALPDPVPVEETGSGSDAGTPAPPETEAPETETPETGRVTRTQRRRAAQRQSDRWLRALLVAGLVLAVGCGAAAWALWPSSGSSGKPAIPTPSPTTIAGSGAQLADPSTAMAFLAGASAAIPAVTSYDYRNLAAALSGGLAVTTGGYQKTFQAAMTGSLATTAQQHHVVQSFSVLNVGIGAMDADGSQAQVLVFGQQEVTDDTTKGQPRAAVVTLCASMQRIGNRYLISNLTPDGDPGLASGTHDLQVAETAGAAELANLLTYRRASFDSDLQRALAGATGPLRGVVTSQAAAARQAMTRGKYDLSGAVSAIAVSSASGDSVQLLVAATSNRIGDAAGAIQTATARYQLTVLRSGGSWLVSQAQSIGAAAGG